jgi:CheY-like chemotaxis protein
MKTRHRIVCVDDDETELTTFRRLYEGDRFQVTTVCAQFPRSALPAIEQALGEDVPDLFVLDLFFPVISDQPMGFTSDTSPQARAHLSRVMTATQELESLFFDEEKLEQSGKELLKAGSDLVFWAQKMLRHWCDVLGQLPSGGIALMRLLHERFCGVPTVFYSRKATITDVKLALEAGALDVLIKPHRSLENLEAVNLRDILARYSGGSAPEWRGDRK